MMTKEARVKKALDLREDPNVRYNCAQAVLMALRREEDPDEAVCAKLGALFGGGMRCGSICGAATGALMALGLHGKVDMTGAEFLERFQAKYGARNCQELVDAAAARGEEKKVCCNRLVCGAVELAVDMEEEK